LIHLRPLLEAEGVSKRGLKVGLKKVSALCTKRTACKGCATCCAIKLAFPHAIVKSCDFRRSRSRKKPEQLEFTILGVRL